MRPSFQYIGVPLLVSLALYATLHWFGGTDAMEAGMLGFVVGQCLTFWLMTRKVPPPDAPA